MKKAECARCAELQQQIDEMTALLVAKYPFVKGLRYKLFDGQEFTGTDGRLYHFAEATQTTNWAALCYIVDEDGNHCPGIEQPQKIHNHFDREYWRFSARPGMRDSEGNVVPPRGYAGINREDT